MPHRIKTRQDVIDYLAHDKIECLECGKRYHFLPVHIKRVHGLSAEAYKDKFNLPAPTPLAGTDYRQIQREKLQSMIAQGIINYEHLPEAVDLARTAGRGIKRDFDVLEQAKIAANIPKPQLPTGAKRADGRDADKAREYQRAYRKKRKSIKSDVT